MRRIIEKVVTVVTTTTWKISWEADTPPADHPIDTDLADPSIPEHLTPTLPSTNHNSPGIEEMKVDQTEEVNFGDPSENEP
jgi:hypothetical protein